MQASELKGRALVVLANAEKVGQVEDVLFDAPFGRYCGFASRKAACLAKPRRFREKASRPLAPTR